MKSRKNVLFASITTVMCVSLLSWLGFYSSSSRYDYETEVIQVTQKVPPISVPGTIYSRGHTPLFAKTDGVVSQVRVKAGDLVKKGDVLASLDVNEVDVQRYHYLSALEKELKSVHNPFDVLNSIKTLSKKGFYNSQESDDAKNQVLKVARDYISLQSSLEDYERRTEGKILRAPFDGVVAEVNWRVGEFVAANRQLIPGASVFRPEDKLEVKLEVPDEIISYFNVGQETEVWLPVSREAKVSGKVSVITPTVVEVNRERFFSVIVTLEPSVVSWLRLGMRVMADVYAKVQEDGVWVPRESIDIDLPEEQVTETVSYLNDSDSAASRDRSLAEISGDESLKEPHQNRTISAVGRSVAGTVTPTESKNSSIYLMESSNKIVKAIVRVTAVNQDQAFIPNRQLAGYRVVSHYRPTKSIVQLLGSGQ